MYDRTTFYNSLGGLFASLDVDQMNGLNYILSVWEKSYSNNITEYLAYCLATAYHETARTMQPVEEYGRGRGRAYGPTGFWGRGYVQLTWERNYKFATEQLNAAGIACDLVANPSQALNETIAAYVMFQGMIEGWFTGKALHDYFSDGREDPIGARRIINGNDRAEKIAGYYHQFKMALEASEI